MTYLNFAGVEDTALESVRRVYSAEDFARLQELKAIYDPRNERVPGQLQHPITEGGLQ